MLVHDHQGQLSNSRQFLGTDIDGGRDDHVYAVQGAPESEFLREARADVVVERVVKCERDLGDMLDDGLMSVSRRGDLLDFRYEQKHRLKAVTCLGGLRPAGMSAFVDRFLLLNREGLRYIQLARERFTAGNHPAGGLQQQSAHDTPAAAPLEGWMPAGQLGLVPEVVKQGAE